MHVSNATQVSAIYFASVCIGWGLGDRLHMLQILRLPVKEHLRRWMSSFISPTFSIYQQAQPLQLCNKLWYWKKMWTGCDSNYTNARYCCHAWMRDNKCEIEQSALQRKTYNVVTFWQVAQSCSKSNTAAERWWFGVTPQEMKVFKHSY